MPKLSAGILVYRIVQSHAAEVLLVHPGGPFWAKKDAGSWSFPKGEYAENDDALQAARREFAEEVGQAAPTGDFTHLGEVKYSNKILTAWAVEDDVDVSHITSNTFTMEWPPRSGKTQEFPEVDKAGWFNLLTARRKLVKGQVELIDRLEAMLQLPPAQESPRQISLL